MSGKWDRAEVPKSGWTCDFIYDDLEEEEWEDGEPPPLRFTCQMCEEKLIRYVHVMSHPDHETLETGCKCAGNMDGSLERALKREADFKNIQARRKNWLKRAWRVSRAGNDYINADGFTITTYLRNGNWAAAVNHRASKTTRFSKRLYATEEAVKLAAFEVMVHMKPACEEWERAQLASGNLPG